MYSETYVCRVAVWSFIFGLFFGTILGVFSWQFGRWMAMN